MFSTAFSEPTPSQLLATAIRKRRWVMNSKNRELRMELLLGETIKNLCKFIGEERASRKRKRFADSESLDDENSKVQRISAVRHKSPSRVPFGQSTTDLSIVVSGPDSVNDGIVPMDTSDNFSSPLSKHSSSAVSGIEDEENDPFGLDKFFASLRTCRSVECEQFIRNADIILRPLHRPTSVESEHYDRNTQSLYGFVDWKKSMIDLPSSKLVEVLNRIACHRYFHLPPTLYLVNTYMERGGCFQ